MLLSIFSNPNITHLIEIFFWMLGSFLIGLFFGRMIKTSPKKNKASKAFENENEDDSIIVDDVSKIRATKTFERGGKQMVPAVPIEIKKNNGLNFNRIGQATFEEKDDLQKIKGIGPSIEKNLNEIGIFTFKQISNFNSSDISKITELIATINGRIERDDWIGQAFKLLKNNQ
jgi:predicted flap endonuclease-1-like 5' DNA nuclease